MLKALALFLVFAATALADDIKIGAASARIRSFSVAVLRQEACGASNQASGRRLFISMNSTVYPLVEITTFAGRGPSGSLMSSEPGGGAACLAETAPRQDFE